MKTSLQLRTSQHLALTPQLQQSIRLLQLSTLELQQEVETLLNENPLLERVDDTTLATMRLQGDGIIQTNTSPNSTQSDSSTDEVDSQPEQSASLLELDWGIGTQSTFDSDFDERPQLAAPGLSLYEHLDEQARINVRNERDLALVRLLIDSLDENGYLVTSLEEILENIPLELGVEIDELKIALSHLQHFDPTGVGARDVSECLSLQLQGMPKVPFVIRRLSLQIVQNYLPLLAQKDFTKLKRFLNCDDEDLREAQGFILRCTPKPAIAFSNSQADFIVPDVFVSKSNDGWRVTLNQDVIPRLRINSHCAALLKQSRTDNNMQSHIQDARAIVKNMRQRFDTILRVAQAIADRQQKFFTHGEVAMRPLVLREIADTLGLHESTISRVTTQKFMLTPHGIFELKYFFGSHVATEAGGEASSTAIRALIKQLIGAENQKSPLSDNKLAEMLGEQGMLVARRTVAKYREALKIPPASLRKSL